MAKVAKTAQQIERLVNASVPTSDVFVSVQPDAEAGWCAIVVIAPRSAHGIQDTVDRISMRLRKEISLKG